MTTYPFTNTTASILQSLGWNTNPLNESLLQATKDNRNIYVLCVAQERLNNVITVELERSHRRLGWFYANIAHVIVLVGKDNHSYWTTPDLIAHAYYDLKPPTRKTSYGFKYADLPRSSVSGVAYEVGSASGLSYLRLFLQSIRS